MKNPQLNYRIEKSIQDEYKKTCQDRLIDPGQLLQRFMIAVIEDPKIIEKVLKPQD